MTTKKYKLFSTANGEKAPCAFFNSPAGCRNGDSCKFSHGETAAPNSCPPAKVELSDDSSMSSESEDEAPPKQVQKQTPPQNNQNAEQKKKKKRKSMDDGDIFSKPRNASNGKGREQQQQPAPTSNKKAKKSNPTPERESKPQAPSNTYSSMANTNAYSSLLSNLPVASFSIPGATPPTLAKKEPVTEPPAAPTPTKKATPKKNKDQRILPTSTEVGRKWQKSVIETRKHERFANTYDFKKYKDMDSENGIPSTWIKAKQYGKWCASNPQAIAIDCEMCETQDPLTGAKNPKALCRVSIVNAEKPEEVLLDTLVKPSWPVTDYRTRINGIAQEHLENVQFTLRHAQAFMLKLCSQETVIVGHAVHNDLVALNMEHDVVSDSSYLFRAKDSPLATPSLKDTVKTMLNMEMPETHDSVNDARKALECVLHWVNNDGNVALVERSAKNRPAPMGHKLFVHRIPKICTEEHLNSMFVSHTFIQPTEVEDIQFNGSAGKTHVHFKSPKHANLAFETLDGKAEEEASGRLQKKVYLKNGTYLRVRKMISAKRSFGARDGPKSPSK